MGKTFNTMSIKKLKYYHSMYIKKLNDFKPDSQDYKIIEDKLEAIEEQLDDKCPQYLKPKNREVDEDVKDNNYTLLEAADSLNVTRQTMYNWIKRKMIKHITIGRTPYIPKSEIERIFKDGTI